MKAYKCTPTHSYKHPHRRPHKEKHKHPCVGRLHVHAYKTSAHTQKLIYAKYTVTQLSHHTGSALFCLKGLLYLN